MRLRAADTVIVLDFPLWRCAWRAARRSRENWAFWRLLLTYRRSSSSFPAIREAIGREASHASLRILKSPKVVEHLLAQASTTPH
ncbi:hypothetical protein [Actinomadura rupiterrae]|uniref:hypothetical protein n=1 Tax=Actinomadura rupiterrae TaxID=559627 RepID=UPI0020A48EF3|nr:hypothetical protein [Actinomadura rupiterrae]MCP2340558.1 hypothetical protein [Actinomadura rupiterrae]